VSLFPGTGSRPYYGWPLLGCLSAAETVSWGVLYYSFTVFVRPLESELGWSRAQVTGAFSAALLASGLAALPVGRWLDRHGPRGLMSAGSAAGAALFGLFATVESLWAFYAVWLGLGAVMAAVLYEPAFAVVATWFVRHRDRALVILTVSAGLASTFLVPLATWLVAHLGWRGAAASLGLLLAATTLPLHALALRRDPASVGQHPDGDTHPDAAVDVPSVSAVSYGIGPRFWRSTAALTLVSLVTVAATVHLVPYLTGAGIAPAQAAAVLGLVGLMQLPGRLLFGALRRVLAWEWMTAAVLLVQSAALAVLASSTSRPALVAFVVLFGAGNGLVTLLRAAAQADHAAPGRYGRVGGVLSLFTTLGRAAGPFVASLAYAASGGYRTVLAELGAVLVVAAALAVAPSVRPRAQVAPAA
jgi:MFS family permease